MADVKITALTAISANPVNPATFPMPMVDLLDTSQAASGSTRKVTVNQILGAGGVATLASATITGAATVGTTLGVTGVSTLASAVVTGDLTVRTDKLAVTSTGVGCGTLTPVSKLVVRDGSNRNFVVISDATQLGSAGIAIGSFTDNAAAYAPLAVIGSATEFSNSTSATFFIGGTTAMTLNSTGLGIRVVPVAARLQLAYTEVNTIPAAGATTGHNFAFGSTVFGLAGGSLSTGDSYLQCTRWDGTATNYNLLLNPNGGNVGIGVSTFGTSAAKVLSIATGTEPTTGPAGSVQFFTSTRSASNTIPAIFTEGSGVTNAAITNTTVTNKIAIKVNGTIYYLLATTSAA